MRVFEKARLESHHLNGESAGENSSHPSAHQAKDFYGTRRPRAQQKQPSRQIRIKPEEPQCVILSSDEEEEAPPDIKKFKEEDSTKGEVVDHVSESTPATHSSVEDSPMDIDNEAETPGTKGSPSSIEKWTKGGWPEPYFLVNCRSVRAGSYRFTPTDRVLLCSKGIRLEAPVWKQSGQTAETKIETIEIESFQLLQLEVHFSRSMPVIFIYVAPSLSREISKKLGLKRDVPGSPYFDTLSKEECERRLTLLPSSLDETAKNAIRQAFVPKGVFKEINVAEANKLLFISSPPEVIGVVKQMQPKSAKNTPESPKSPVLGKSTATTPAKDIDETVNIFLCQISSGLL